MVAAVFSPVQDSEDLVTRKLGTLSWSSPGYKPVENAGQAFIHFSHLLHHGQNVQEEEDSETDESDGEENDLLELTPENVDDYNFYEIIGLDKNGLGVTPHKLKTAYRRALLKYHPDKTGRGDQDAVFMAVQKALETLGDVKKKRAYDSVLDFDETIPTGDEEGDFYEIYGPVFVLNARFSVKHPVPKLGDDDTPIGKVEHFYSFWTKFESWRDFSLDTSEFNLDEADSRMEKRWMMKENERLAKAKKKEEYLRLSRLVEGARALDPRLRRQKEAERAEKEAARAARAAERRRREEEARERAAAELQAAEERAAREKEERRAAKEVRDQMKKEMRKKKREIRTQIEEKGYDIDEDDLELFLERADLDLLSAGAEVLGGPEGLLAIQALLGRAKEERAEEEAEQQEAIARRAREAEEKERAERARKAALTAWSEEELSCLAKAVQKFPAGSQNRWLTISNFIAHMVHTERSKEECIQKYQEIQTAPGSKPKAGGTKVAAGAGGAKAAAGPSARASEEDVWTQDQQAALEEGLKKHPASMDKNERWSAISAGVEGKTKKQCVERFKALRAAAKGAGGAAAPGAPAKSAAAAGGPGPEEWTQEQQLALEEGLKKYPAAMEKNERWKAIAAGVEGKTKKDCISRFKELRAAVQAQKK